MKKQLVVVGITLMLFVVGLSGCTDRQENNKNKFVGIWTNESSNATTEFFRMEHVGQPNLTKQ